MIEKKRFAKLNIERKIFQLIDNKEVEIKENETVYTGDEVVYEVILTNVGNIKAEDIAVESYIPNGVLPYYSINKKLKRITKSFLSSDKNKEDNCEYKIEDNVEYNIEDKSIVIKKENDDLLITIKDMEVKPGETCVIRIYGIIAERADLG